MPAYDRTADDAPAIAFDEFTARLDEAGVDLTNEDGVEVAAALLARLNANRDFLADFALAELKDGCSNQSASNRYSGQVMMLHRKPGQHFVRANFWPSANDPVVQASGTAHYFYDLPHDHNFDFLTIGHAGPGYESDWYDYDHEAVAGYAGEEAALRFVERGQLTPGRLLHYRAHRDVHRQLPPQSLSISLNIVPERAATMWHDQYIFDVDDDSVARIPTFSPLESMLRIALLSGADNARDLAEDFAVSHPSERVRWTSWQALIGAEEDAALRTGLLARATSDASRLVNRNAAAMLRAITG